MNCLSCDVPITLLTSQRNGNLDTCLTCAIAAAPMLRYILKRRSDTIIDEVICQAHYQEHAQPGRGMAPLADRELGAGYTQTVVPYVGDRRCDTCESDAAHQKGAA